MNTERGTNIRNEAGPSLSNGVQRMSNSQTSGGLRNRSNHGEKGGHTGTRRANGRNARNNNLRQSTDANAANVAGSESSTTTSGVSSLSVTASNKGGSVYSHGGRHANHHNHHYHHHHHHRGDQQGQSGFDSRNSHTNNQQSRLAQPTRSLNECLLNDMEEFPSLNDAVPIVPQTSDDSLFGATSSLMYGGVRSNNSLSTPLSAAMSTKAPSATAAADGEQHHASNSMTTTHNTIVTSTQHSNASSFHVASNQPSFSTRSYNNRRSGNSGGGYKNNSSRGDVQHQGINNAHHNKGGGGGAYRMTGPNQSSNASQQMHNTSNQHNSNHFQSGNQRPRGNRRNNIGGNFDHRRSAPTASAVIPGRDYGHSLPTMMNGLRIGVPPPPPPPGVQQMPVSYYAPQPSPYQSQHGMYHHPHQPMLAPLPLHPFNNASAAMAATQHKPEIYRGSPLLPGLSSKDIQESEHYKSRTLDAETNNNDRVRYQVEFYFCNWNLRADMYMRSLMDADGWVHASQLLSFNRVAKYGLSVEELGKTLQNSTKLEQKSVESDLFVRRSHEPKKWTEEGLCNQLRTLFMTHPELDPIRELHAGGFIPTNTNGAQPHPMLHFAYSLAGYNASHNNAQLAAAAQYGLFQFDENTGMMNAVYDGPIMPNLGAYDNNPLLPSYSEPNLMGPAAMSLSSFGAIPPTPMAFQSLSAESVNPTARSSVNTRSSTSTRPSMQQTNSYVSHPTPPTIKTATFPSVSRLSATSELGRDNAQETEDFGMDQKTFDECLEIVESSGDQPLDVTAVAAVERLCRFWTHTLVLSYDNIQYTRFKTLAKRCSSQNNRHCIDMLYKFYTRYINRYPICSSEAGDVAAECDVSQTLFDEFQRVAVFDYDNNESVNGLHQLVKFYNQHFNSSRTPIPLNNHVSKLLASLGLKENVSNLKPALVALPQSSSN